LYRLKQLRLRENQLFLVLTIVIGVLAGLSAVLFAVAIDQTSHRLFGLAPSQLRLFLVPLLVSVVTGILLAKVFTGARGSGVPQTKTAYHLASGTIPVRVTIGKFITGVLTIGAGHSLGREGPSVQIGAGLASLIGRWLQLPPRLVQRLIPVGAAGALAAAFNTPISAVVFVLEEIMGDLNAAVLGSTIVASVTAVVVARSILGNEPLFHVPAYHLVHPAELAAYAMLGVVGGVLSLIFAKGLLSLRGSFKRLPESTSPLQPALGGLLIGMMLLYSPGVMGVGYEYVDQALNGGMLFQTMMILCVLKIGATIVSYSSGNAGGVFAPSLFIGAMAGGAIGTIVHRFAPFPTAETGAYALVGMGVLFAGIIRAPLTSVFMIFELTQDYQIVVPLMVANVLSYTISRRYQPVPLYEALLRQDNIHLPTSERPAATNIRSARHLMETQPALIAPDQTVHATMQQTQSDRASAWLVGSGAQLSGIVTRERLSESMAAGLADHAIASIADPEFAHVHADHSVDVVLERFEQSPQLLPVVSRSNARHLEGVITIESVVKALGRH
jgi:CIC family chloride channel protein